MQVGLTAGRWGRGRFSSSISEGPPTVRCRFTLRRNEITAINILADPERLRRLDLKIRDR